MTELELIYAASIAGAVLFFVAGGAAVALRRPRPAAAATTAIVDPAPDPALRAMTERANRAEAQVRRFSADLTRVRADAERIERDAERARADAARARADITRARALSEASRGEAVDAIRELEARAARIAELDAQLAERTRTVRDLSTENEHLKGRLRDAEGMRADYVRLRTAATDAEYLRREVIRLEAELREVHLHALGARPPRPARGSAPLPTSPRRTIGELLATAIERFADDGTRSIAVADTMGFPLASSGNDGLALAAYAALLMESATRSRQFLPVAAPAAIELVDTHGTRVSVWSFEVDADRLLLANLAVAPVDERRLAAALADLSAILTPTQLASHTG